MYANGRNSCENGTKFLCYFCNKEISNDSESAHVAVCGSVLVACPFKCGSYTPRNTLSLHQMKCPNRATTPHFNSIKGASYTSLNNIGTNASNFYRTLNPKENEIKSLQNRCGIIEQQLGNLIAIKQTSSHEFEKILEQNKLIEEWKEIVNLKLENIRQQFLQHEQLKSLQENHWTKLRQYLIVIEKLKIEVNNLKAFVAEEKMLNKQSNAELNQQIIFFKNYVGDQMVPLNTNVGKIEEKFDENRIRIDNFEKSLSALRAKFSSLDFDVKALTRIATEAAEKIEIEEREFKKIQMEFAQMKIDLEIIEEGTENCNLCHAGRLLWKISNVENRLKKAKESNTVLRSPVFYSHGFGYKIKVLLYLNGLNKWKDRYALICLHVIKGEYDMTLKWPCNISGTITLKDLENFDQPKNVTKTITAKKEKPDEDYEDPKESSPTFIFIPHPTLFKSCYFKNDTIFLDINITKTENVAKETNF